MKTVGVYQAKTQLTKLLAEVEAGARITITRHGHPVAELGPPRAPQRRSPDAAVAAIIKRRERLSLDGVTIRELIEDGRR
ncbi:MAG: type II toxin-antitoxin system prevent-host-death family antitoxin [Alphaproteobacteria bacterium]|nr:type II toxin-antitoxin system prevent-host-death family antitoxin [Alphaproteobacteria bacterium]